MRTALRQEMAAQVPDDKTDDVWLVRRRVEDVGRLLDALGQQGLSALALDRFRVIGVRSNPLAAVEAVRRRCRCEAGAGQGSSAIVRALIRRGIAPLLADSERVQTLLNTLVAEQ